MKTYNTYQEAKIASPEYAIFERGGVFGTDKAMVNYFEMHTCNYKECKPSDYCVTSEEFLKDGYAFVAGDFIFSSISQEVYEVDEIDCIDWNTPGEYDKVRYVLRASAIDRHEITEWNGEGLPPVGVECLWIGGGMNHGDWGLVIVHAYSGDYAWIEKLRDNSMHTVRHPAHFRKPETQEQRKERERLEAAYDLYLTRHTTMTAPYHYDEFLKNESTLSGFLAIVDKTNYRKGE